MLFDQHGTGIALNHVEARRHLGLKGGDYRMHRAMDNFDLIGLTIALASLIRVALG